MGKGLYIHIPFCEHICSYCDFAKEYYQKNRVELYLNALKEELASYDIKDLTSIYIGGGTPSSLNEDELEFLLSLIDPYVKNNMSFTFEANVENLSLNKIKLLKKHHVNRVSLGVQTFNDRLIKIIARHHDELMVRDVITKLKENGINDINIDLIYGLPSETKEELLEDIIKFTSLEVSHISTYALSVNKNTFFYNEGIKESSEEEVSSMYELIVNELKKKGFNRYEVSNFAKNGYESKHNLLYWRNEEYFGIGVGASGYLNSVRYDNTKSIDHYIKGKRRIYEEKLSPEDKEYYSIMLGLRLKEGVKINASSPYKDKLDECVKENLLERNIDTYKVKDEYLFILDFILRKILY